MSAPCDYCLPGCACWSDTACLLRVPPRCRAPLPVAPHLRPKPWRLQLPEGHPERHALLYNLRGWSERGGADLPYIIRDVLMPAAESIGWAGEA